MVFFLIGMIPTGVAYGMVIMILRQRERETKQIIRSLNHLLNTVAEEEI